MTNNRRQGKKLLALSQGDYRAVGSATLDELEHFGLRRPTAVQAMKKSDDTEEKAMKALREQIQRTWDKARKKRAAAYSDYIEHVESGRMIGGTPPLTLYVPEQGTQIGEALVFSYKASIIAIDGETQLEARFMFRDRMPESGEWPILFALWHGIEYNHARQILHDLNCYATPIPEAKLSSRNETGAVSRALAEAIDQAAIGLDQFNTRGSAPAKNHLFAEMQALHFLVGHNLGPRADRRSASTDLKALNRPGLLGINSKGPDHLAAVLKQTRTQRAIGKAKPLLWQIAGALSAGGHDPAQFKWTEATEAFSRTANMRVPFAERFKAIADAMIGG